MKVVLPEPRKCQWTRCSLFESTCSPAMPTQTTQTGCWAMMTGLEEGKIRSRFDVRYYNCSSQVDETTALESETSVARRVGRWRVGRTFSSAWSLDHGDGRASCLREAANQMHATISPNTPKLACVYLLPSLQKTSTAPSRSLRGSFTPLHSLTPCSHSPLLVLSDNSPNRRHEWPSPRSRRRTLCPQLSNSSRELSNNQQSRPSHNRCTSSSIDSFHIHNRPQLCRQACRPTKAAHWPTSRKETSCC